MSERAAYSRVYWSIIDDPKFVSVFDDDHHLAGWLRLLLIADQAHPASAHLPANVRRGSVKALADVGLIDVSAGRYRVRGLDAERKRRSDPAKGAASARWSQSERTPDAIRTHTERNARSESVAILDETRRDEGRQDETRLAREGLPNLDTEAIRALEERTGRTWGQAGERQLTEYDELIESHGLEAVCGAMDSIRDGKPMTARQLVWGAMKLLEPMPSTRVAADAEHAEEVERNSRRGVEATQKYLADLRAVGSPKGAS